MTGAAAGGATPYYASPSGDVVLYRGDAAAVLRALPAGSVHCCITSPPYFSLRDYGTATWEGGDAGCSHTAPPRRAYTAASTLGPKRDGLGPDNAAWTATEHQYRAVCGKCGARRVDAQIGLEATVEEYVENLVAVFREVRRVLHPTGTCWINLGDGYNAYNGNRGESVGTLEGTRNHASPKLPSGNGLTAKGAKNKDLLMIPSRVAIALRDDGWWLRAMIPWLKRNAMPESATDRPTTATEYVFLLSQRAHYFYDTTAVAARASQPLGTPALTAQHKRAVLQDLSASTLGTNQGSGTRYRRDADWWFDSLRAILDGATGLLADEDGEPLALPVNPQPFPGSHFAVFPEKLVEPMLLASTSAAGCCPACGAPWTRTSARTEAPATSHKGSYFDRGKTGVNGAGRVQPGERFERVATGWRAGCACDAGDPTPAVCLDPFAGSGTVGVVARKHGRHFIGVDLSAAYLAMARERLGQLALPFGSGAAAGG